ncbi:NTF2-like N-terminal transpeptidase domain-containing protein [Williamsia sp. R60]
MLEEFSTAIEAQDAVAAAATTSAPGQARESLAASFDGMSAQGVDVQVSRADEYADGTATFALKTTWRLDNDRELRTDTSGLARRLSLGWRIQWNPELLARGLTAGGSLRSVRTDARPAPAVEDRFGQDMLTLQTVNHIALDPVAADDLEISIGALVNSINPVAQLVTPGAVRDQLAAANGKPATVVSIRDSDMAALVSDPASIPGVSVTAVPQLVPLDRRIDSPVLDGVRDYWQGIYDATAGWSAQMVAPGTGPVQLAREQGPPAPNIGTAIEPTTQLAALEAVVEVAQPASILVLDTATGAIRASMRNDLATDRDITIGKKYTSGSTLEPVAHVIDELAGSDQATATKLLSQLGLGVDFSIPGVRPEDHASAPNAPPVAFRPGDRGVSALNMGALGMAVARTDLVVPWIISGEPGRTEVGDLGPVDKTVLKVVDSAMKTTATTGDASDLTDVPGLRALVGTNGLQGPGWFVGIQGREVIVIYCEGERSGSATLAVAQRFLASRPSIR